MTLGTHAIVGAGIVGICVVLRVPDTGLVLAFASHFAIDAIPHWDYRIRSVTMDPHGADTRFRLDRDLTIDLLQIGTDMLLGIALGVILFGGASSMWIVFFGACLGVLPDALQFAYARFKHEPLVSLQRFHEWIHTDFRFKKNPRFGKFTQVLFVVAFILVAKLLIARGI